MQFRGNRYRNPQLIRSKKLRGAIRAPIVQDENFLGRNGLSEDRINCLLDRRFAVVSWNNHADFHERPPVVQAVFEAGMLFLIVKQIGIASSSKTWLPYREVTSKVPSEAIAMPVGGPPPAQEDRPVFEDKSVSEEYSL